MPRGGKEETSRRVQTTIRMDPELYGWLDAQIGPGMRWKDLTHAIEFAVRELKIREERK